MEDSRLSVSLINELKEKLLEADSRVEKSWKAVIRRRRAEIHAGKAKVRPAQAVMRDALQAIS